MEGLGAYGGLASIASQTLNLPEGTAVVIPMDTELPAQDVTYTPANSITIAEAGTYELTYMLANADADEAGSLAMFVRRNGNEVAESAVTTTTTVGESVFLQGMTVQELAAGDVLDLALFATGPITLTLTNDLSATLIVKKLN